MANVKIYTTPACPYCHQAKAWFKEHKIKYREFNVAEDEKARDYIVEKTGMTSVPQIEIGEEVIVGFDPAALKKVLSKERKSP